MNLAQHQHKSVSFFLSVWLPVSLSHFQFVFNCLYQSFSLCLSKDKVRKICRTLFLSVCLSLSFSINLFLPVCISLSFANFLYLSVSLIICPFDCLFSFSFLLYQFLFAVSLPTPLEPLSLDD